MTGQQRAVLWIGLILVGLNLVSRWSEIRSVIFSGAGIGSGIGGSSGGGGGFHLPIPFPPSIGILSQPSQSTKKSNVQIM
jgi:hypothetical protein